MKLMERIDILRELVTKHLDRIRECRNDAGCSGCADLRGHIARCRAEIASLLVQWWAQGCKETDAQDGKPDCACTRFTDGSSFALGSFAGGAAPAGAYSFVNCTEVDAQGKTTHHRYVRSEEADAGWRGAGKNRHFKLAQAPAEKLAAAVAAFRAGRFSVVKGTVEDALYDALEEYEATKNAAPLPAFLTSDGLPDEKKIARCLLDTMTGGALSSLICQVRDEVIPEVGYYGGEAAQELIRRGVIDNLRSNLRALGENVDG